MTASELALVFAAGVLSFLSPCVLPMVPVYLSATTGLDLATMSERGAHSAPHGARVLRGAGSFVAGFSVVFVALGLSATALGRLLARAQVPIGRGAGLVMIGFAVLLLAGTTDRGLWLAREWRLRPRPTARPVWFAPAAGAAFAFGWTPCIGPVLGSVLAIAAGQDEVLRGGVLLSAYSAGLAVPLLLTGLAFGRLVGALRWTRRHSVLLTRFTGLLLASYGLLLVTGSLASLTQVLQSGLASTG